MDKRLEAFIACADELQKKIEALQTQEDDKAKAQLQAAKNSLTIMLRGIELLQQQKSTQN